jgi:NNP family nitrate/nitrite transporter-like MFS transporter
MQGTYWLILVFGCLSGCGVATFSVGAGQSSYWFPKNKQGFALGIFGGLGTLGAGVFAIVLPLLLHSVGFVSAYYIWTAFMIAGTILYFIISCNAYHFQFRKQGYSEEASKAMAIEAGQELFPAGNMKQSLLLSARIPETWILVIAYFVTFGGFMALTAWLPTYWQKAHGLSVTQAGLFTSVYACLAALLRIPGGNLADKIGGLKVSLFAISLLGTVAAVMAFSSNLAVSGLCTLIIAVAFGLNNAAIMKLVPVYVSKSVGGASGWVGGLGAFGGFVIPPVLGKVVDTMGATGYYRGFLIFSLFSVIVMLILYFGLVVRNKNK